MKDVAVEDKDYAQYKPDHHRVFTILKEMMQDDLAKCPYTYFRVKPIFTKVEQEHSMHKVHWAVHPLLPPQGEMTAIHIQAATVDYFSRHSEATRKYGPPPKGGVERAVERLLNRV